LSLYYDPQEGSSNGGIWSFNGSGWVDVTPKNGKNYAGLTVSESEPNTLFRACWINPEIRSDQGLTPLKGYLKAQKWGKIKQNHCTSLRTTQSNVSKVTAELDK